MRERPAPLPPDVTRLGWVSLLTDAASEAIYPVLPLFLAGTLGAPVIALGVIEGAAEATAACLRLVSGRLSDLAGRRKPLVLVGYGLSSAVRPFVALATGWLHVLAIRFLDRVGKGIRGAPRDAMLAALAPAGARGRVFGYHRAMDHAGAVVGPACAAAFLWLWPGAYRALFACAALPGALAVLALARVADTPSPPLVAAAEPRGSGLPAPAWRFFAVLALFTLGNASDAFILLRLSDLGAAPPAVAAIWGALHVVKSGLSTWGGGLSDRFGRRTLIAAGWLVYAVAYAGFAAARTLPMFLGWCAVYGVYYALAEGSEKALVADLVPAERRGTAFGWYHAVVGLGALVASVAFGAIWQGYGAGVAFGTGAALAVGAAAALALGR